MYVEMVGASAKLKQLQQRCQSIVVCIIVGGKLFVEFLFEKRESLKGYGDAWCFRRNCLIKV